MNRSVELKKQMDELDKHQSTGPAPELYPTKRSKTMQKNLKIQVKYQVENEAGELVDKKEWMSLNKTLLRFLKWTSFRSIVPPEDK